MKIFVYGTLMSGMRANDILLEHGSEFLGHDSIKAKMYTTMFSYPFIALDPDGIVVGEIYEINDKCLADLDHYEGYKPDTNSKVPSLFLRSEMLTENSEQVIVYHAGPIIIERMFREPACLVESGNWKWFVQRSDFQDLAHTYFEKISRLRELARKQRIEARRLEKLKAKSLPTK